jgi:hypothetical protein
MVAFDFLYHRSGSSRGRHISKGGFSCPESFSVPTDDAHFFSFKFDIYAGCIYASLISEWIDDPTSFVIEPKIIFNLKKYGLK